MAGKPFRVVRDTNYPQMYRLEWPDGVRSADMYNLSRAKDHLRRWEETAARKQRRRQSLKETSG